MKTVDELRTAFEAGMSDAAGDYPDMHPDEYAFDIAISIALMAEDRAAAEDFLRGELGYVPDTYKGYLQ